jgi:predicted transcriptional regulator
MSRNFLVIDPAERPDVLHGLASPARTRILRLLHRRPGVNVNDLAEALHLPQSSVSSNLQILEGAGLIRTETRKGRKGNQKLCFAAFDEVLVMLRRCQRRQRQRYRGRNANRSVHQLRGQRALRPLFAEGSHWSP